MSAVFPRYKKSAFSENSGSFSVSRREKKEKKKKEKKRKGGGERRERRKKERKKEREKRDWKTVKMDLDSNDI